MKLVTVLVLTTLATAQEPLRVCATTANVGSIAESIGGDVAEVITFAPPGANPHFITARPSFARKLHDADALVIVGLELEVGWIGPLLRQSRNNAVQVGGPGYIDASRVIQPLEVPTGRVDRGQGDVHMLGNPHYLLDPINGVKVAELLRDRFTKLRPESGATFDANYDAFRQKLGNALVGERLAADYDFTQLATLHERGRLAEFLESQNDELGGWFARFEPHHGTKVVSDHRVWSYFYRRFGLVAGGFLEATPGIPPTTTHLGELIETMRDQGTRLVLAVPYYDPKYAALVEREADGITVRLAHQVGALPNTGDYFAMTEHNVEAVLAALARSAQ